MLKNKRYAQKLSSKSKFSPMGALVLRVSIQQSSCLVGQPESVLSVHQCDRHMEKQQEQQNRMSW